MAKDSNWKITGSRMNEYEAGLEMATLGFYKGWKEYSVVNTKTGEKKRVEASNAEQVGHKIAKGQFMKK